MRPNGGLSSSGTQNMQSSTGQYSTHAGEPAHPVQHSVMTASSFGFFLRGVVRPLDFGSHLSSSGTIPTALVAPGAAGICVDYSAELASAHELQTSGFQNLTHASCHPEEAASLRRIVRNEWAIDGMLLAARHRGTRVYSIKNSDLRSVLHAVFAAIQDDRKA